MPIYIVPQNKKSKSKLTCLAKVIYFNFEELVNYSNLKHNINEITRILHSKDSVLIFFLVKSKVAAYLIGEIMKLNDGRTVFYITYIFTGKAFRHRGIASKLMGTVDTIVNKNGLDGILLTCDSEDKPYNFYLKKGFMPDLILRTYGKFEVLFK